MFKRSKSETRRQLVLCLFVLGIITAVIAVPYQFGTSAAGKKNGLVTRTVSGDDGLPKMWDIREQSGAEYVEALARFRQSIQVDAARVADVRDGFVRGEQLFRQQHPGAKVEYNLDIRTPEILTPDVYQRNITWLTSPTASDRSVVLRNFIKGYNDLVGLTDSQIDGLKTAANYVNPDGNLSFVRLEQEINGIPVFRGEVTAGFRNNGQMIRVVNNLAPGMDYGRLSTDFGNPVDAVVEAAKHINHDIRPEDVTRNATASTDLKVVFGEGDSATLAEKIYFPTEPGVAVPAWRVLIWQPVNAYYVIVDAESGVVLWHKNISDDQAQSATYQIYSNTNAYSNMADHAAPLSPGPNDPGLGTQGTLLTRNNVTLIGNEGANSFNNNGWITDGTNITDGNANEAGLDRVSPDGVDAPMQGDTTCPGAGCRTFTSTWNPPPGSPAPGDDPLTPQAQRGAVIQMFYIMNLYHDELYKRGFNEPARNFQHVNFAGQGGLANDRVRSEGQDSSGSNNANFQTPADGTRGRMQMYLWTGPTPDRDGTADAAIVIHEVTHGTSNRMHGNGSGLGNQGGMMGEGWGDFYAHTMTAEPTDPINAVYGLGGYSLLSLNSPTFTANHYYGIRRFPTAVIGFTGGPNNLPHNPLTFKHINSNCDTTLGTTTTAVSSAYPRSPVIATSGSCSQVHNAGEIWKSALWEVRALLITRLGFATGTTRVLEVVTSGMKLAPLNPFLLHERDAIIAGADAIALGG
ncbi:MAG: M36 family metallopeptidase, partial [Pyrinomonadaceae bacterium]